MLTALTIQFAHGNRDPRKNIPRSGPDAAPVKLSDAWSEIESIQIKAYKKDHH